MWFRLIESANETCYMYQISCQSDELCREGGGGGVKLNIIRCRYMLPNVERVKGLKKVTRQLAAKTSLLDHSTVSVAILV